MVLLSSESVHDLGIGEGHLALLLIILVAVTGTIATQFSTPNCGIELEVIARGYVN